MTAPLKNSGLGPAADIEAAADHWAAKAVLGTLSARERAAFEAWLAEPVHAAAYARTQDLFGLASEAAADPTVLEMRAAALKAGPPAGRGPPWRWAASLLAAVVVAGGAGYVALRPPEGGPLPASSGLARGATPAAKRYETGIGERRELRLDDGSVVTLNTGSALEVAYTAARRDVRLLRGQALFQVAHNRAWPFVVTAGDRQVTAVGTAFDVRLDGDRVKVVLVEGRVRVDPLAREGLGRLIPQLAQEDLAPGQQLTAEEGISSVTIAAADVARTVSWRNGQVIFRDDSLSSAAAELNRYSARRILIADPRVGALKVSGVFGTDRPENFVAAITSMFPVDARETAPGVVELNWRAPG